MSNARTKITDGPVWDPLVKLTHWIVAAGVLVNGVVLDDGSLVHSWVGYAVAAMLALRLLWGVVGPDEARFTAFPPTIRGAIRHLRDLAALRHRTYRSHNPAGALMVYALWSTLAVTVVTGIAMGHGDNGDDALSVIHEAAAGAVLTLAALHVFGVLVDSTLAGRTLIRGMLPERSSRSPR